MSYINAIGLNPKPAFRGSFDDEGDDETEKKVKKKVSSSINADTLALLAKNTANSNNNNKTDWAKYVGIIGGVVALGAVAIAGFVYHKNKNIPKSVESMEKLIGKDEKEFTKNVKEAVGEPEKISENKPKNNPKESLEEEYEESDKYRQDIDRRKYDRNRDWRKR